MMNVDAARGSLGLHAMVNPMVAWIWVAAAVMALGALVALVPARARAAGWVAEPAAVSRAGDAMVEG